MDYAESSVLDAYLTDTEKRTLELFQALVREKGALRESYAIRLADVLGNPGEFAFYVH